jgi:hypothetical protein
LRIEVGIPVFSPPILSIFASSKERSPPSRKDYTGPACTALPSVGDDIRTTLAYHIPSNLGLGRRE